MPRWAGCPPSSGHGVGVRVEQCVPGVDGFEVCVSAHGSKFNDAVVALVKAGGFGTTSPAHAGNEFVPIAPRKSPIRSFSSGLLFEERFGLLFKER